MPRRQSGVVLVIALIVLLAMTLASIAMVRSVDTSTMIAGNLAFKQSAIASGDQGVEAAILWLQGHASSLEENGTPGTSTAGYLAMNQNAADLTGSLTSGDTDDDFEWSGSTANVKTLSPDASGNTVKYVIHRMCDLEGPLNSASCATESHSSSEGNSQGIATCNKTYTACSATVTLSGYYRITVRVDGPRNSYSFIQTIVSL